MNILTHRNHTNDAHISYNRLKNKFEYKLKLFISRINRINMNIHPVHPMLLGIISN